MKKTTTVETTVVIELNAQDILAFELNAQDILAYVFEKELAPKEWAFFSVDVKGKGVSQGATLILNHSVKQEDKP